MARPEKLFKILDTIDGGPYGAYKEILGRYDFGEFILFIDHVQADPFASPSRVRINVPAGVAAIPAELFDDEVGQVAVGDFLARRAADAIRRHGKGVRGSGSSGLIDVDEPGQEILDATAVSIRPGGIVDARLYVGLPAKGRSVMGRVLKRMIQDEIPPIVQEAFLHQSLSAEALDRHVRAARRQRALRAALADRGLVAFVADGARLPRRSGVDDRPLKGDQVVAFESPSELRVTLPVAEREQDPASCESTISGLGIPRGVTLVVGGGYHGKTTLLKAIERGVYDHVPGDGREHVVSDPTAFKIRAEDARSVQKVDISPFMKELPYQDTTAFTTGQASGSTSQAANIIEAISAGARTLLLDEDTSATNFLIRDHRMQLVVPPEAEPIIPFIDRVRELNERLSVSTILVIGGCGDYLDVADTVIHMDHYRPLDVTERAKRVAAENPTSRTPDGTPLHVRDAEAITGRRTVTLTTFSGEGRKPEAKIRSHGVESILYGKKPIDLTALEQLVDASQVTALAEALRIIRDDFADGHRTVEELTALVIDRIDEDGLDCLTRRPTGGLARFRGLELTALLNRMRTLKVHFAN